MGNRTDRRQPRGLAAARLIAASMLAALVFATIATPAQVASKKSSARPASSTVSTGARLVPETIRAVAGGTDSDRAFQGFFTNGAPATSTYLPSPNALVLDSRGNLYIADSRAGAVFMVDASTQNISVVAGSYTGSQGGEERLTTGMKRGARSMMVGGGVLGTNVSLEQPVALAVGSDDSIYICDIGANVIYRLDGGGYISIVAGSADNYGYTADGAVANGSMLENPDGVAVDASGTIYFSEAGANVVRRIDPQDGTLHTVAGSYSLGPGYGGDNGPAINAQLQQPAGLALNTHGILYIADESNNSVRAVDLAKGTISTVAGNGSYGHSGDGGPATSALFRLPVGVAVDAAGQLYITDLYGGDVRRVDASGNVSTVAGGQQGYFQLPAFGVPATSLNLGQVSGIAIDPSGTVYVSMVDTGLVARVGPDVSMPFPDLNVGASATSTISIENRTAAAFTFTSAGFTTDQGSFSVAAPQPSSCLASMTLQPGHACDVTVTFAPASATAFTGNLLFATEGGAQMVPLSGNGLLPASTTTLTLSSSTANAGDTVTFSVQVQSAAGTGSVPTGTVTLQDQNSGNTVFSGSLSGGLVGGGLTLGSGDYELQAVYSGDSTYSPSSSDAQELLVSPRTATITVSSSPSVANMGDTVSVSAQVSGSGVTPTGLVSFLVDGSVVATAALTNGSAATTFNAPPPGVHRVTASYGGDQIYTSALTSTSLPLTTHGGLLQFLPGETTILAGRPSDDLHGGFGGDGGPATNAYLQTPTGVAVDGIGNVYIADEQNNVIRKVDTGGTITTVAGIPYAGSIYSTRYGGDHGPATSAYLDNPAAVAVDAVGNLYIADYSNNVVRRVDAVTQIITTVAGDASNRGYSGVSGPATSMSMNNPSAVAVDGVGNLYIADSGNSLIRKVDPSGQMTTIAGSYFASNYGIPVSGQPATSVPLNHPMGVAIGPDGLVYIADSRNYIIRKIDASGNLITVAGGNYYGSERDNVDANSTSLNNPLQMAFDRNGTLYFAEGGGFNSIRAISPAGIISTPVGFAGDPSTPYANFDPTGLPSNAYQMVEPSGVAVDPNGNLIVADTYDQTILKIGPNGALQFGPQQAATDPFLLKLSNLGDAALSFGATPYTVTGSYGVAPGGDTPCNLSSGLAIGASCTLAVSNQMTGAHNGSIVFSTGVVGGANTVHLSTLSQGLATTTGLYNDLDPIPYGNTETLYGIVQSPTGREVTGTVNFYDGSVLIGNAPLNAGEAILPVSTLAPGYHLVTAEYVGSGLFAGSVSDVDGFTVTGTATATTLTTPNTSVSVNDQITLNASVIAGGTYLNTGTVNFYDNGALLGSAPVISGNASFQTVIRTPGDHPLTAVYQANAGYNSSTGSVDVTATGGSGGQVSYAYTITASGLPTHLHRGQSATVALTFNPIGLGSANVTLTCGTLPSYVTCTFAQNQVLLQGTQQQTVMLTISTSASNSAVLSSRPIRFTLSGSDGMPRLAAIGQ